MTNEMNEPETAEGRSGSRDLLDAFDEALNVRPHLLFEIGYTRPTDWMVHIWDATDTGIKYAQKIISTQNVSRDEACREAAALLRAEFGI